MAKKSTAPIVISIAGLSKGERRRVIKDLTRDVSRDKGYRRALKKSETPIPKKAATAAATAAVVAAVRRLTPEPVEEAPKKGFLDWYTEVVGKFAAARKKRKETKRKKERTAKKNGLDPKTGLFVLPKLPKLPFGKKEKPYRPRKSKKK